MKQLSPPKFPNFRSKFCSDLFDNNSFVYVFYFSFRLLILSAHNNDGTYAIKDES